MAKEVVRHYRMSAEHERIRVCAFPCHAEA